VPTVFVADDVDDALVVEIEPGHGVFDFGVLGFSTIRSGPMGGIELDHPLPLGIVDPAGETVAPRAWPAEVSSSAQIVARKNIVAEDSGRRPPARNSRPIQERFRRMPPGGSGSQRKARSHCFPSPSRTL